MSKKLRRAFGGGGNRSEARDIVHKIELAAKFLKDDRAIRREDDKSETEKSIQSYPSPEFLNSLPFIKKFYPVLNLLHAPRVPQMQRGCSLLHLLAIRTRCTPSVRKFATPLWGEGKFTKVTHDNSCNSRHSERLAKESSLLQYKASAKNENNSTETNLFTHSPILLFTLKRTAFTLAEGATHVAHCDKYRRVAFTLAEVLITLGIIGVVAALTIPSIIHKYKSIVLQNQLKKSYSNIQQAVLFMKEDLGIDNLIGEFVHYDADAHAYTNPELFYKEFDKYMKVQETLKKRYPITNYSGTQTTASSYGNDLPRALLILPDGSSVGRRINYGSLVFVVDTNGPYKGPNRLGFDIFQFKITDRSDIIKPDKAIRKYSDDELDDSSVPWVAGWPCYKDSNQLYNGVGCAWYAVNDINPDDETKKYWNSLPW